MRSYYFIGMVRLPEPPPPSSMQSLAQAMVRWNHRDREFASSPLRVDPQPTGSGQHTVIAQDADRLRLARALGWRDIWVCDDGPDNSPSGTPNLNPIQVARALDWLLKSSPHTAGVIADMIGVSRSQLVHRARLARLCAPVAEAWRTGQIPEGAVRLLVSLDEHQQLAIAKEALARRLSVRQIAELARQARSGEGEGRASTFSEASAAAEADVQRRIGEHLGAGVRLVHRQDGSGEITIRYQTLEILEGILERMGVGLES